MLNNFLAVDASAIRKLDWIDVFGIDELQQQKIEQKRCDSISENANSTA
jgi:hypothetical protein